MADLRVMIVDDEPLARAGLRELLSAVPGVVVAGECGGGEEAVLAIEREHPDVVLLDIEMPEVDGFDVLEALDPGDRPAVIFVTAYAEHAVRAFEVNAVDYVLKPADPDRLRDALGRARERLGQGGAPREALAARIEELVATLRSREGYATRLLVRHQDRLVPLPVDAIDWIEAADNYVRLHAGSQRHLLRETMKHLEQRLDPARFARIHRSTIVNLARVKELQPLFSGEFVVLLTTGAKLTLSRSYREDVERRLGA